MKDTQKIMALKIASILTDGLQVRAQINSDYVEELAEALKGGSKFPPVIVFRDENHHYLADGFHRLEAAKENGAQNIMAEIRTGTKSEALKFALGANATHGLRLTNKDKRHSAEIALREFPKLADAELGRICAVSNTFISSVRKEIQPATVASSPRTGGDGKVRNLPPPRKMLPAQPSTVEGSNHKKAHLTGISKDDMPRQATTVPPRPVKPAAKPEPKGPLDSTGIEVPPECLELWTRMAAEAQDKMSRISLLKGEFKKIQDAQDIGYVECDLITTIADLELSYADAKRAKPHAVCPACNGVMAKGCTTCKGRGFISDFYWKTFISEETRKLRTIKK
jgi:uncharacterized ParB-like nuclease family protein